MMWEIKINMLTPTFGVFTNWSYIKTTYVRYCPNYSVTEKVICVHTHYYKTKSKG